MTHKKEESSDDILKPKYPPTQDMKPSEREDEEISLPPDAEPNQGDQMQEEEEQTTSPQGEEEEWEDELTGEKLDNPYLPSQRLAEFGMEDDMYPPKI
jgi:hypothetical protein